MTCLTEEGCVVLLIAFSAEVDVGRYAVSVVQRGSTLVAEVHAYHFFS